VFSSPSSEFSPGHCQGGNEPLVEPSRGLQEAALSTAPSPKRLDLVTCQVPGETESGSAGEQPDKG